MSKMMLSPNDRRRQMKKPLMSTWKYLTVKNRLTALLSLFLWLMFMEESLMWVGYETIFYYYDPNWTMPEDREGLFKRMYSAYIVESIFVWPYQELFTCMAMLLLYYNMAENLLPHVEAKPIVIKSPPAATPHSKSGGSSLGLSKLSAGVKENTSQMTSINNNDGDEDEVGEPSYQVYD